MSMIPFLQLQLDPILMNPWHYLSKWFQIGDATLFVTAHGKSFFEYAEKEPNFSSLFNEAMGSDALLVVRVMIEHCKRVFEGLKSLVDVGGGNVVDNNGDTAATNIEDEERILIIGFPADFKFTKGSRTHGTLKGNAVMTPESVPISDNPSHVSSISQDQFTQLVKLLQNVQISDTGISDSTSHANVLQCDGNIFHNPIAYSTYANFSHWIIDSEAS
ncbi:Trans-resveratrol di-O-methyltransferase [Capsicum baccatum]|uniref:Trans-resveratrol di-O-methyltransferase n=1 Tax=Capsicum baccatum TaxID=33114 RepID=A0A2G2UYK5_CAPBA|nr:Trans-resveratrol di-O-methyltransferase [Capsicum baccatum]